MSTSRHYLAMRTRQETIVIHRVVEQHDWGTYKTMRYLMLPIPRQHLSTLIVSDDI